MDREVKTVLYRYLLQQDIDGSDAEHLVHAIEDEEFPIREIIGEKTMVEQIKEGMLSFDYESNERLPWFGESIRTMSVYISEYIIGLEFAEGRNAEGSRIAVEIRKYVGRRGDLISVPLTHSIAFPTGEISPGPEDIRYLETHWQELPRWAQDAYRIKFPELRRL
jgi:hypothetical protein